MKNFPIGEIDEQTFSNSTIALYAMSSLSVIAL